MSSPRALPDSVASFQMDPLPQRSGLMLVGHGTRDPRGTTEFFELAKRLRAMVDPVPVAECLLEFQEPSIEQAWQTLMDQGVDHVRVAPLLLFAAGHAKQDIPEAVASAAGGNISVTFDQCRSISRHPAMIQRIQQRLSECLEAKPSLVSSGADHEASTAVILVGRGSYDPCAQADMRTLTAVVGQRYPGIAFETAFYAMAEPRLPEVIDHVATTGRFQQVIVQPHLLFQGRLFDAIAGQVEEGRQRHPNIEWTLGGYLGPVDLVAQAIAARAGVTVSV